MKLNLTPIPSNLFNWDDEHKRFVTEASQLRGHNTKQRMYDDACDVGFPIVSTKTGAIMVFTYSKDHWNNGDLEFETYVPTEETKRKFPHLAESDVIIFND